MSDRYLCIHGHFYQPARENPWLDAIGVQDTAAPYHDWNERITAECYARNAAARVLDADQRIIRIVNNYSKVSFNIGPTLLRWLARYAPDIYALILEADRQSQHEHYGHGNAIAQVYNHVIMPLASRRDKITQVIWAIRDFERRFRRHPEGMWLPETAVDLETLEILAAQGIGFTILAPHQAKRVRASRESPWQEVTAQTLDVSIPYRCRLPGYRSIVIFFYDVPIARAIAFESLLTSGVALVKRLVERFSEKADQVQMLTVATDGESYGHHHRFGEMALSYALHELEAQQAVQITNFGAHLAAHPPAAEVELQENTSWSCVHGVERWRADCGCNTGKGWHQRWRGPLREAITWLKGELDTIYEQEGKALFIDPWAARDDVIELIDRAPAAVDAFLARHAPGPRSTAQRIAGLRLLEMQRQGLLMQSSDGWFFDEVSGVETVQVLTQAARAIELAAAFGARLEEPFVQRLRAASGNLERYPDGAAVYERLVRPMAVSTPRIVAHHAITSLVQPPPDTHRVYASTVARVDREEATTGEHTLVVGRVRVRSTILEEEEEAAYALLHFGGHEVHCAVRLGWAEEQYTAIRTGLLERFRGDVLSEVVRAIDAAFGPNYFTLRDLILEDRRRVLAKLTQKTLVDLEATYRELYQGNRALMEYLRDAQVAVPPALVMAAVFVLTRDLEQELTTDAGQALSAKTFEVVSELRSWGREVHADRFEPLLRHRLEAVLADGTALSERLTRANQVLDLAEAAGFTLTLWEAQNRFYELVRAGAAEKAIEAMRAIGSRLSFNMDALMYETPPQNEPR